MLLDRESLKRSYNMRPKNFESILKIVLLAYCNREGQAIFICLVTVERDVAWWSRLKRRKSETFHFQQTLSRTHSEDCPATLRWPIILFVWWLN